ncbi:hypothetical protein GYA28_00510 [Candidatus Roizmanbacteria bacterium]|jgi:hypothetical protein|nr:hypothetical protein [Candidatus Roizmanbacteria bacterium]
MKKRINLLVKQKKYLQIEELFKYIKLGVVVTTVIFFVIISVYLLLLSSSKRKIDILIVEKKQLLEYVLKNKEVEAKFKYFHGKNSQIQTIMKNDVNFYPYYSLLKESLKNASPEPVLESVVIDRTRATTFTLSFNNLTSLLTFLKYAESPGFLSNFSELSLHQFGIDQKNNEKTYSANLVGKFIQLNENKN